MPFLVQRFINTGNGSMKAKTPNGFLAEAVKMYYDTAQVASRGAMLALREIVPVAQILYGTDYPFRSFDWTRGRCSPGGAASSTRDEMRGILSGQCRMRLITPATRPV